MKAPKLMISLFKLIKNGEYSLITKANPEQWFKVMASVIPSNPHLYLQFHEKLKDKKAFDAYEPDENVLLDDLKNNSYYAAYVKPYTLQFRTRQLGIHLRSQSPR